MSEQTLGSIGGDCVGYRAFGADQRAWLAQEQAAREMAHREQLARLAATYREKALEAALRTTHSDAGSDDVLAAARAYEAYLKGESSAS